MTALGEIVCEEPTSAGGVWRRRVGGVWVVRVKGNAFDVGRDHGIALCDAVPHGPMAYYRGFAERYVARPVLGAATPWVWPALKRAIGRRVAATMPDFGLEMLRGLAEGSGVPFAELLEGCVMPDTLVWLSGRAMRFTRAPPAVRHRAALGLGCTSALAWGAATSDGRLLFGRNFDYHGLEAWPQNAAVMFYEPAQGLRYVALTAAGVIGGGITAVNEAGLALAVHQHMFSDQARLGGTPIGLVGDLVMRQARDLDEAQEILARYRPIGCWTYLIADGRKREVLCWEEDPRRQRPIRVRAPQITFGYANIYLDQALGQHETSLYGGYWRNNLQRHRRANALLEQGLGQHTPQTIAHILGDTGERCRLNEGIASLITVASVVMRPEDGVVWLGTGRAPTCRGTFIAFDLSKRDYAPEHGTLTVGEPQPTPADQAFAELGQAYLAYIDQNDVAAAWAALQRACALAPAQPLYFHLSGLLALHNQAFAAALTAFDRAAALDHPDPVRQSSIFLWRGRSHDLVGQRAKAVADYQACLDREPDVQVERAARAGLRRAFLPKQCRRLKLDLIYGDAVFV